MNEYDEIEKIKQFILANKKPAYFTTNKKELRVRCPYCGDSKSDKNHAHLYIQMRPPFKFYCQRCNTAGVLNYKTMKDFQLFDSEISISLENLAKKERLKSGISQTTFKKKKLLFPVETTEISIKNFEYFTKRFNEDFSFEDAINNFKMVTDAKRFFEENKILLPPENQYNLSDAIGFVSHDNSHIVFRDTSGKQRKRYFNFSLYPDLESYKFYTLKSNIDLLAPETTLVMTEGIFDIIGVYNSFFKDKENKNTIFTAVCGKGFNSVISYFIHKGFLNLKIKIFADSDVDISFFKNLKENSIYLKNETIEIFYNKKEKDFGIPKENIEIKKIII